MGFFDFYIIPLAKKLKECGVFGVSSDEYLNYAMENRRQWEVFGEKIVRDMTDSVVEVWTSIEDSPKSQSLSSGLGIEN